MAVNAVSIDPPVSHETGSATSLHVLLLIGSGVTAAAQIGKAITSVAFICRDLALGLDLAGFIVATFAMLGELAS